MQEHTKSIQLGYYPNNLTAPTDVSLNWNEETKQIVIVNRDDIPQEVRSFKAQEIKKSLIANGSNTLILELTTGEKYTLEVQSGLPILHRPSFISMFVNSAIARTDDNIYELQAFLAREGVVTHRSSLVKIIAFTFLGFLIFLGLLIAWVVLFYI